MSLLRVAQALPYGKQFLAGGGPIAVEGMQQELMGRTFDHPVGLAAGFDKDAVAVEALAGMGFSAVEVGTITPKPQAGNPRPRLFRYRGERSLENCMGFNNGGQRAARRRLARVYPARTPIGVNVGKNRATPIERAGDDYLQVMAAMEGLADYFVINVSSPNTPGLRSLQDRSFLSRVVGEAKARTAIPVLIKLAPELTAAAAVELIADAVEAGAVGAILTNTTSDYSLLPAARKVGGLSGAVLREKSFALFEQVAKELFGHCLLVSVGGIDSGREAYRRLRAGASLVQLYTALVYGGPGLVREIVGELRELMTRDGAQSIAEVVGADR